MDVHARARPVRVCVCVCVSARCCVRARARGGIMGTCERVCVGGRVAGCVLARVGACACASPRVRVRISMPPLDALYVLLHLALELALGPSPLQSGLDLEITA